MVPQRPESFVLQLLEAFVLALGRIPSRVRVSVGCPAGPAICLSRVAGPNGLGVRACEFLPPCLSRRRVSVAVAFAAVIDAWRTDRLGPRRSPRGGNEELGYYEPLAAIDERRLLWLVAVPFVYCD